MITLEVDQNNDIFAQNGILVVADGVRSLVQRSNQAMKLVLGEARYALDEGIPYFQAVFSGSPNLLIFEAAARKTLLAVSGVTGILSFVADISNNTLTYTATLATDLGQIVLSGSTETYRQV